MICMVLAGEWMESVGCCAELRAAEEWHMPVYQWDDEVDEIKAKIDAALGEPRLKAEGTE